MNMIRRELLKTEKSLSFFIFLDFFVWAPPGRLRSQAFLLLSRVSENAGFLGPTENLFPWRKNHSYNNYKRTRGVLFLLISLFTAVRNMKSEQICSILKRGFVGRHSLGFLASLWMDGPSGPHFTTMIYVIRFSPEFHIVLSIMIEPWP